MNKRLHLFQGYGIELEYMIVDRDSLDVAPFSDELLRRVAGSYVNEYMNGAITWSNELTLHQIELKCTTPTQNLDLLEREFEENIQQINQILKVEFNAKLMPTAAHPWMNPKKETFLWPHEDSDIYEAYHRIFNCQTHGWANVQSVHINLPFYDDEEFAALHTAVRLILPILPALAASSPILECDHEGYHDKRLAFLKHSQHRIESISGKTIPERITSKRHYQKQVYDRILTQLAPYDAEKILDPIWTNSRGAIARFDRGTIEIRLLDIQECPKADLAIAALVIQTVRMLVSEKTKSYHDQQLWEIGPLYDIYQNAIHYGSKSFIDNSEFLDVFGFKAEGASVIKLWKHLLELCVQYYPEEMKPWVATLENILHEGSLSSRILVAANSIYTRNNLSLIYQELSQNLEENKLFQPCDQSILS